MDIQDRFTLKIESIINTNKDFDSRIEALKAVDGFETIYKCVDKDNNSVYRILFEVPQTNFNMKMDVLTEVMEKINNKKLINK